MSLKRLILAFFAFCLAFQFSAYPFLSAEDAVTFTKTGELETVTSSVYINEYNLESFLSNENSSRYLSENFLEASELKSPFPGINLNNFTSYYIKSVRFVLSKHKLQICLFDNIPPPYIV